MTQESKYTENWNPILPLEGEGGEQVDIDVVALLKGAVGAEPINAKTVFEKLQEATEGTNYQPKLPDALSVLEKASYFFDIKFGYEGKPGYSLLSEFSGPPVIFENTHPYSYGREIVDLNKADSFQELNPDWQIITEEDAL